MRFVEIYTICLTFLCVSAIAPATLAQESPARYYEQHYFDVAVSGGSGKFAGALAWNHLHGFGKKQQRFKAGYGVRFTGFVAANKYYTTAPAKYTSTEQNLGTIFSKTLQENIDTITTATAATYSVNLAVYLQYTLRPRLDIGVNIDLLGFSFGSEKRFNILSSVYDAGQAPVQQASPTSFNLLLTSDNDKGSLNSEFYIRYWLTEKIGIRAGYTFLFSEYRTKQNLSFDNGRIMNDRYRYKAAMALVAVTFKPFGKS
ncbi:MAG TPA: hypothetical protein VIN08_08100 [Ohtaekwangia sp.]|uniref:hypothetical protein n=1 Tax=Ohtaekwangia sp. TaxID=2066019 RepID=UPI002F926553